MIDNNSKIIFGLVGCGFALRYILPPRPKIILGFVGCGFAIRYIFSSIIIDDVKYIKNTIFSFFSFLPNFLGEIPERENNLIQEHNIKNNTGVSVVTKFSDGSLKEQTDIQCNGVKCIYYNKRTNKTYIQKWSFQNLLLDSKIYGESNWIEIIQNCEIQNKEDFTDEELVMLTCFITHNTMISPITLGCGHIFDKYSIIYNMHYRRNCPLCQVPINCYEENEKIENLLKKCKFVYVKNENNICIKKNISITDIRKYYEHLFC
jgi:hypothetical protein